MNRKNIIGLVAVGLLVWGCGEKKVEPLKEPVKPAASKAAAVKPVAATPVPVIPTAVPTPKKEVVDPNSPLNTIKRYTEELREMVGLHERKQKGLRDEEKEKQVQAKVREFFDFPTLARLSLGRNWKRVSVSERKKFSRLFIELVEDSYIRRSRDLLGDYDVTFTGEKVAGGRSKVSCRVAREDADIEFLYELHRKSGKWMIFNISLDDVDLIRNYQSQFNQIIKKRGWNELIKLMQKKLDDGEDEDVNI